MGVGGMGVEVGSSVAVGSGVKVGKGVAVGSGVGLGTGEAVAVGRGIATGFWPTIGSPLSSRSSESPPTDAPCDCPDSVGVKVGVGVRVAKGVTSSTSLTMSSNSPLTTTRCGSDRVGQPRPQHKAEIRNGAKTVILR